MDSSLTNTLSNDQQVQEEKPVKQPAIKKGWIRAIIGAVVISIASGLGVIPLLISGAITPEMMEMSFSGFFKTAGVTTMSVFMLLQFITAFFFIFIFRRYVDKQSFKSLGFTFSGYQADFTKGLFWGIGLIGLGFLALYFTGFLTVISTDFSAIQWLSYIALFAFVALNEEILVRGYVLSNLMASMNKYWALIISALMFSVMHLGNDNTSWISTINLFLAGILLGIYTIHTRNLWFPIAMHFTWNLFQGPVLGFEVSGTKMESVINQEVTGHPLITGGEFGFEGSLLLTVMMIAATIYIDAKYKKSS